ncbi:MAG: potassium channel protein [Spirochaetes bacterium]|jgi:voltage-gated potassium channel|nr:potassium channel protein [Spirochaetota bacterium]
MRDRTAHQVIVAGVIVLTTLLAGTVGYMLIEGWGVVDAFYMTVLSVSTTGFREVHPLSNSGKLLTVAIIIAGVLSIAYLAGRAAQLLIERYILRRRGMDRQIRRLRNHYIVCGYGRMGRHVCTELEAERANYVVIEKDEALLDRLISGGVLYVQGDATNDEALLRAGIEHAKGLITVVSSDPENVYTTLSAKTLNPNVFVVSRALQDETESKLRKAGADRVIKPYEHVGQRMAQLLLRPGIVEFMDTVAHEAGKDIKMEEIIISDESQLVGHSLLDSPIRDELNIIIVVIHRQDGELIYNPSSIVELQAGDHMIAVGDRDNLKRLAEFCV